MTRIPLPQGDALDAEQRRVHDAIASLRNGHIPAHYRAALYNPELSDKWQQLGELLRYRTTLPLRLSELAILVTAIHYRCDYEWQMHVDVARQAGLPDDAIESMKKGQRPEFSNPEDTAIYDYCSELFESRFVSGPVYKRTLEAIGVRGIVELTALVGYYAMVAMSVNAHELPLPAVKPKPRT